MKYPFKKSSRVAYSAYYENYIEEMQRYCKENSTYYQCSLHDAVKDFGRSNLLMWKYELITTKVLTALFK